MLFFSFFQRFTSRPPGLVPALMCRTLDWHCWFRRPHANHATQLPLSFSYSNSAMTRENCNRSCYVMHLFEFDLCHCTQLVIFCYAMLSLDCHFGTPHDSRHFTIYFITLENFLTFVHDDLPSVHHSIAIDSA